MNQACDFCEPRQKPQAFFVQYVQLKVQFKQKNSSLCKDAPRRVFSAKVIL